MRSAIAAILLLVLSARAEAAEVAITLDDLPYAVPARVGPEQGLDIVERINRTLAAYDVTAMGFAIGEKLVPEALPALQAFAEAGHTVANHTWSHPDYDKITAAAFGSEVERADTALAPWMTGGKFFRFPFLHSGATAEKRAAAAEILAALGYRDVPVSIDDDDFQYNSDYMAALAAGDAEAARRIAAGYLAHMKAQTAHFRAMARERLGRDVKHILLLHMNRINADHLGELLAWYRAEGWTFITAQEALTDPVYGMESRYDGPKGLSQIERVTWTP
ncbi:polysaccharide deacetylase family protein [Inquilinus sp. NPDC058860]|uniref:polysaccharide deacetylase family protein n=1 Tax=Inquilinus sp. NPDC058860 TaxID=3346652 RepID=UPI0036AF3900